MSFPIKHYINRSATNVVEKDLESRGPDIVGTLRDGCSIIDPVILIEANAPGFQSNMTNYFYIEAFNRYYYITNVISVTTNLCEVHCHVDVLMSYKDQIREQTAIVARQEREYNLMLDDGFFMSYQNPKIQTKLFSNATPFETQEFVLIVAGS